MPPAPLPPSAPPWDPSAWAEATFGGAGTSLPAALTGAYRLLHEMAATPAALTEPGRARTLAAARGELVVLLVQEGPTRRRPGSARSATGGAAATCCLPVVPPLAPRRHVGGGRPGPARAKAARGREPSAAIRDGRSVRTAGKRGQGGTTPARR